MKYVLSFIVFIVTMTSAFAGTLFYKERPKILSGDSKGYELIYNADKGNCVESKWNGDKIERVIKDVWNIKCRDFVAAKKRVEKKGSCTPNRRLTDKKSINVLGIVIKEELILSADCLCYTHEYQVGDSRNQTKEFESFRKCKKAFN